MSEFGDLVQEECLKFSDRIIKLNDYLLQEAVKNRFCDNQKDEKRNVLKFIQVYLQSVASLSNQLLRSGTSIAANNAEALNAISKADYKNKSFIALKEARESLYWLNLLHRNSYLSDKLFESLYFDCEELVKILVARCKKLGQEE